MWKIRLATDVELFSTAYFPHYCTCDYNEFHRDYFGDLGWMERAIRRADAAPRGYAKSALKALIKPIHDIVYGLEQYIIFISNTQDQANQKLKDIRTEVYTNVDLINDYGICFHARNPGETQFVLHAGEFKCLCASYGAGVEIRGIRFGASRPTKIILDDSEHSEEVLNEAIRAKYEQWFFEVVSQVGTKQTNIEFIGTIMHRESLLAKLTKNPAYQGRVYKAIISWSERQDLWDQWTRIYTNIDDLERISKSDQFYLENKNALLAGTRVLWPERESYIDLMKEMVEKGRRAFMKEKQNEPIGGDEALFEKFHWYREVSEGLFIESNGILIPWKELKDQQGRWLNAYGALDPAAGQTKAKPNKLSDFSCILSGIYDSKGRLFVHSDWTKRAPPTKFIAEVFEHHLQYDYQKFGVEINLYRNLLLPNMVAERKRIELETKKSIHLPFYDIENVENKDKRINTLEPKVTHGWILLNRALSQEFIGQLEAFPHGDHDDGPDALEMLWGLVKNRYKASTLSIDPMGSR